MARASARASENAPGDLFVDDSCIDCETCRVLAPEVFTRSRRLGQSVVGRQPIAASEALRARMAIVSCPTSSIGSESKADLHDAVASLPQPIEGEVHYCGYASESSYGAASYLVRREAGNVLVDSPRAARPLMDRIESLGGVARMFLTHRDDVADHARYAHRFGCERILHAADVGAATRDVERRIEGTGPVSLGPDLVAIPVPGHTRGSVALLYRGRFLFTGDHLWGSGDGSGLDASSNVCWYSWSEQTRSMERLLDFDFEWVLPGHGPRFHAPATRMRAALEKLVLRMKRVGG
ncbi:MAG: MBL fold metallo-hydrolase [Polyangiaceae bacterium]|jgi:glyoxylase-like metal-dependent hydrolase (beta-lactamase superfamily II)/ferredoxin